MILNMFENYSDNENNQKWEVFIWHFLIYFDSSEYMTFSPSQVSDCYDWGLSIGTADKEQLESDLKGGWLMKAQNSESNKWCPIYFDHLSNAKLVLVYSS